MFHSTLPNWSWLVCVDVVWVDVVCVDVVCVDVVCVDLVWVIGGSSLKKLVDGGALADLVNLHDNKMFYQNTLDNLGQMGRHLQMAVIRRALQCEILAADAGNIEADLTR